MGGKEIKENAYLPAPKTTILYSRLKRCLAYDLRSNTGPEREREGKAEVAKIAEFLDTLQSGRSHSCAGKHHSHIISPVGMAIRGSPGLHGIGLFAAESRNCERWIRFSCEVAVGDSSAGCQSQEVRSAGVLAQI